MDTVTHALTGAVIGYAGFRQRGGRVALWTTIVAAEFPDVDLGLLGVSDATYLQWHRTFTHSAVLLPVWALLVAGLIGVFARRTEFKWLYGAALAGIASHLFLDWLTSYGTALLWPFSTARFQLNWVFMLDPYIWAMLGLTLWATLRRQAQAAPRIGLLVVGGYLLMCALARSVALAGTGPGRVDAFAQPLRPFSWTLVRDTGRQLDWWAGARHATFTQYQDDQLCPQAEATDTVKLYRWFAEFPLVERRDENGLPVLRYRDLRFRSPLPDGTVTEGIFVVAKVYFDQQGRLIRAALCRDRD